MIFFFFFFWGGGGGGGVILQGSSIEHVHEIVDYSTGPRQGRARSTTISLYINGTCMYYKSVHGLIKFIIGVWHSTNVLMLTAHIYTARFYSASYSQPNYNSQRQEYRH